jgi:transcriptional regulator with XRE-family HTH domain
MADRSRAHSTPGDLGRRVRQRRADLGLSREQVAQRAGISAEYLGYLEESPATPTPGTVVRVAEALDTTPRALLGGDVETAPGGPQAGRPSPLVPLDRDECLRRLGRTGIGRVAVWSATGPLALPVNYLVVEETVVFRTAAGTALADALQEQDVGEVAFEVDRIDDALQQGWSVLVVGPAHAVTAPDEQEELRRELRPWAGGAREVFVAVPMARLSGRRIDAV